MKKFYGYVYLTTNLINGKKYVGQHLGQKFEKRYYGSGNLLIKALKKYREPKFKVEVLIWVKSNKERVIVKNKEISKEMADLDKWEVFYIKDKKSHVSYLDENEVSLGYNISWGGHGHGNWSEESKKKKSRTNKKYFETHDAWNKGTTASKELKNKLSVSQKKWYETNEHPRGMLGKKAKRIVCEYCKKEIAINIYSRYHGEKCLKNPNLSKEEFLLLIKDRACSDEQKEKMSQSRFKQEKNKKKKNYSSILL